MSPVETTLESSPANTFAAAFQHLMSRAPGPVFPRARRLYFDKYPLEGLDAATPFRTHLLEETVEEGADGAMAIEATVFALVPWTPSEAQRDHADLPDPEAGARYLLERWQLQASELTMVAGPWFRSDRAYLRAVFSGYYRTGGASSSSVSPPEH